MNPNEIGHGYQEAGRREFHSDDTANGRRSTEGEQLRPKDQPGSKTRTKSSIRWSHGEHILRDPLQNKDAAFTPIAFKVAQTVRDEGLGRCFDDTELKEAIETFCWFPEYPS